MSEIQNNSEQIVDEEEYSDEYTEDEFENNEYWDENFCEEEYIYENEDSEEGEKESEKEDPCKNDSFVSILTCLTPTASYSFSYDGICLHLYTESNSSIMNNMSYDFKQNEKGDTDTFYEIVENDERSSVDRYLDECFKYGIPKIGAIIECLNGEPVLNLKVFNKLLII